jgi:hypothetical protein
VTALPALALAALATVQVVLAQTVPLPDETPLTPAQETSIRDEMAALVPILVNGGKSPQEAKLAAHAVGICLGAAYGHSLTSDQAETVCGKVLDAFTIQPGTIAYQLTPDDRAWIASNIGGWTGTLGSVLEPDELEAVQSTMQSCLEGEMRRGEDRDGAVKKCAEGLLPLLNRNELRQQLLQAIGALP